MSVGDLGGRLSYFVIILILNILIFLGDGGLYCSCTHIVPTRNDADLVLVLLFL